MCRRTRDRGIPIVSSPYGFPYYGGEYTVMGLAPYGQPRFMDAMRKPVRLTDSGTSSHCGSFDIIVILREHPSGQMDHPNLLRRSRSCSDRVDILTNRSLNVTTISHDPPGDLRRSVLSSLQDSANSTDLALAGGCETSWFIGAWASLQKPHQARVHNR
jgi:predicted NodU family carbamoyl transferase